jgi:PhzF family phenazine biosynthesis protein
MPIPIYQVDSFTEKPFAGNPAGVCVLDRASSEAADENWMQNVAAEMNLSETAFIFKKDDGYSLRWFTPEVEVEMCGHATLATAHILWTEGYEREDNELSFHTMSGVLKARMVEGWIQLDFPQRPESEVDAPAGLLKALGIKPVYVGKNAFDYFVGVGSEDEVKEVSPDFSMLRELEVRGVIVTAKAEESAEYDFVSRFFAPGAGIDEDPVTGSAHCCLAPYWGTKLGKDEMVGFQTSARGGMVRVKLAGDRVLLGGKAVTVFAGHLKV